jgi:hypothetical protein
VGAVEWVGMEVLAVQYLEAHPQVDLPDMLYHNVSDTPVKYQ